MSEFHTRTIKLKLIVTNEDKKAAWKRIRQIMDDSWKAANWIASGQYLNDQLMRRVYARRKIDPKDNLEAVQKVEEEFQKFFGTKRQATTERDIKDVWPNLPPCVTNPMNQVVVASYNSEKQDMLRGARSLRTYREGMPVTTTKISITLSPGENGGHTITWRLGRTEQIVFAVYYGRDKANNRLTVQRIIDKENDYSAPQIQLKDRDLFLLLPVKEPRREYDLDPDLSVGVDLGLAVPAYVALSNGPSRRAIGSREDFLRVRMQSLSSLSVTGLARSRWRCWRDSGNRMATISCCGTGRTSTFRRTSTTRPSGLASRSSRSIRTTRARPVPSVATSNRVSERASPSSSAPSAGRRSMPTTTRR